MILWIVLAPVALSDNETIGKIGMALGKFVVLPVLAIGGLLSVWG